VGADFRQRDAQRSLEVARLVGSVGNPLEQRQANLVS
jgi:hypothetical protein